MIILKNKIQLNQLQNMGYNVENINIQALKLNNGNLQYARELIIK